MDSNDDSTSKQGASNPLDKDVFKKPCKIVNVNFEGAYRTRVNLLSRMVRDVFSSKSLIDCFTKAAIIKQDLMSLDAFNNIEIEVAPTKIEDEFEVTFVVEERRRMQISAKTAIDNRSTHINLQLLLPNLTGLADSIQLSTRINKSIYHADYRYSYPFTPWKKYWSPNYSIGFSQNHWDSLPSGYDSEEKAFINQIDFLSLPQLKHTISFENVWRYIKSSSIKTPIEIREQAGHSIKSSIKHIMTWDSRPDKNYPDEGILATLKSEFALNLVNEGVRFNRHEVNLQYNAQLLSKYDLICQLNLLAGTILKPYRTNICDKFFAGGPLTLRGFDLNGLAPTINGFPLGESSYLASGIHLYSILPFTKVDSNLNNYIRPHLFANTGTIGNISDIWYIRNKDDIRKEMLTFKESLRYSLGIGLVMYIMRLRLEVNYCIPFAFREGDIGSRGIHWGFGLTYT